MPNSGGWAAHPTVADRHAGHKPLNRTAANSVGYGTWGPSARFPTLLQALLPGSRAERGGGEKAIPLFHFPPSPLPCCLHVCAAAVAAAPALQCRDWVWLGRVSPPRDPRGREVGLGNWAGRGREGGRGRRPQERACECVRLVCVWGWKQRCRPGEGVSKPLYWKSDRAGASRVCLSEPVRLAPCEEGNDPALRSLVGRRMHVRPGLAGVLASRSVPPPMRAARRVPVPTSACTCASVRCVSGRVCTALQWRCAQARESDTFASPPSSD